MERKIHNSSKIGYNEPNKNNNLLTEKTSKTKFTRILGKLKNIRGTNNLEKKSPIKYKINDLQTMTQGDRLNEIKMNRQKLSRSSESHQRNYIAYGLDNLKNVRKRK